MSAYGNSSPQGLGEEPPNADHIGFDISSVDELSLGVCSIYEWDSASSGYDFVNSDFITFAACRDKLATSTYGADSVAYFEFPEYLHQYADDALHDADCDTCRRKYMDSGPNAIEGQSDSMYPENIMLQSKYYIRLGNGNIKSESRDPFANDYSLENGSLCVRIGEHGWPGPPQIGLPETFINPSSFLDAFDNRPSNPVNLLREYSGENFDWTKHNLPYYGYPKTLSDQAAAESIGLQAGYKGEKILENTNDSNFSANGAKKIASFPAWIRPITVADINSALTTPNDEYPDSMPSDGGVSTSEAFELLGGNRRAGRNEWFGSWLMPETYPTNNDYQPLDPQYNATSGIVGNPVPLGPQLVGWLCGFSSPAYKVSKDHYDATNQVWLDTYHYCLDKFTCPELFKESIMDRNGNRLAGSVDFDRGTGSDPCVEPLIPININTNINQNDLGVGLSGMELDFSNGKLQTFKTYAESDNNGKTFLGMCDGGMIEFHKMISATTSNFITPSESNPINFLSNTLDLNTSSSQSFWNGNMRSVYPLMMQGTPFFGIQRPITASQGQLGSWNSSLTYPRLRTNNQVTEVGDYLHGLYSPGNIGLGGEYLHGVRDGALYSMYDSPINIGSNTGRNLRGIPKTGNHIPGNPFNGGTDINTGACSTPEYSVTPRVGNTTSDVTKMYYPCLCDVTHLDPNNSSYNVQNALTNFSSVSMKTLAASSAGNPGYLKSQIRVSDPVAPGVCALKHGDVPRMIVKMYKGESDQGNDGYEEIGGYFPSSIPAIPNHYATPQNVYTYTIRNNIFLDNKFHLVDLLNLGGTRKFGIDGNWSTVITNAIAATRAAESTLPEFESCCLPDGTCTNELEYARCIDQGGTPRNVSCDVPCEGGEMNIIGSCCYVDPDTGRPTSSDGITKQTCKRLKGSFSDTKTARSRVNSKETGCCETCGGGSFRNTDINLTGGRFRSRASSSETDIRTTDITSFDKALNEELKTELQNSYKNCNLPDAYRLSAERYESLIMNYEYEKDLACTNARVKGMDLNLVSYFNCKCTLLDEFVTNMKNTYKENVCQILENQTDPMKTILAVKMEELIEVNRRFENNCLAIIESDTGAVSTFEKAKGCCCRYAKDGYQLGNSRYSENDLVGCSHISKFECDKFVNFNTKWTRCLSECRDGCSTPDNPANCTRCSDRFVERSSTSLGGDIYSGPLDYCWRENPKYRDCLRCAEDRYFNDACKEYKAKHLCYVHRGKKPLGEPKQSPFCTRIGDTCGRKALPFMGCLNPDDTPRLSSSSFVPQTPSSSTSSTTTTTTTRTSQSSSSPPQSGSGY